MELITMHPPADAAGLPPGVRVHHLPFPAPVGYYLNWWHLRALLRTLRPTLLHVHYATGYGTLARLTRYRPTLLSVWGSDVLVFPNQARWKRRLLRRNLLAADYVLATSHAMRRVVEELVGGGQLVQVTPFGVDCEQFRPPAHQPSTGKITIGTVKGLERSAGVDALIHAFALLARWHGDEPLQLLIVGDGPERARLERLTRSLDAAAQVTFVGAVHHQAVPQWLTQMDIFATLSNSEGFGVGVLEASACGLPVVVSNFGGLGEVVRHDVTGLIVSPRDPEAAARALDRLRSDRGLRARMGAAGRAFVLDNFEWSKTVDVMVDLYRTITQSNRM